MDLQPASSLLSPLSRVLILAENQFHLTGLIFLPRCLPPALIYGGQIMTLRNLKKAEEDEGEKVVRGKGERRGWGW